MLLAGSIHLGSNNVQPRNQTGGIVVVVGRNKNSRPTSLSHVVALELQGVKVRDTVEGLSECWFRK